jgi:hypothetical protein
MRTRILAAVLVALSCSVGAGCGGDNTSNSSLSATDAANFASAVAAAATNGLASGMSGQEVPHDMLSHMAARLLRSTLNGDHHPTLNPQLLNIQCNADGTSCTFSDNWNVSETCQTGGTLGVAGTLTGTGTENSAYLSLEMEVTPNSWTCDGPTINGSPYVQINGTFDYPADTLTMTMSGAFTAGNQTCQLNVTVNGNADGSGDISGTVCGNSVNDSF